MREIIRIAVAIAKECQSRGALIQPATLPTAFLDELQADRIGAEEFEIEPREVLRTAARLQSALGASERAESVDTLRVHLTDRGFLTLKPMQVGVEVYRLRGPLHEKLTLLAMIALLREFSLAEQTEMMFHFEAKMGSDGYRRMTPALKK
jgi:hypothetical protein